MSWSRQVCVVAWYITVHTCNVSIFGSHLKSVITTNPQMPLLWLQKWIELGHISLVANFWLSSHNFCGVAGNSKSSIFPTWHVIQNGRPIRNSLILEILKFFNYGYFAKILTRKPKIVNLTNMTELLYFWSPESGYFVVTWCHMKTINFRYILKSNFQSTLIVKLGDLFLVWTFLSRTLVWGGSSYMSVL